MPAHRLLSPSRLRKPRSVVTPLPATEFMADIVRPDLSESRLQPSYSSYHQDISYEYEVLAQPLRVSGNNLRAHMNGEPSMSSAFSLIEHRRGLPMVNRFGHRLYRPSYGGIRNPHRCKREAPAESEPELVFPTVNEGTTEVECRICFTTPAPEAIKCLHCKKWVACKKCATRWILSREKDGASQSCPWCRGDWKKLENSVVKNVR
ncbi:unnamed protein product [Bursaphelenchus okinawaensis]|uniref:RING-type domain-containing protein n=1 Tax=Bursaphelenchus okinawaensis TaxID=465554 RepID=A0A811KTA2_9BILA|nr:unnamed protein product [Bursaphelenchus okinawaensis]CAG9110955.1 unnamed protein product [Bursaphelenchus okinawaensis]